MAYQYRSPLEGSYDDGDEPRNTRRYEPYTRPARGGGIRHRTQHSSSKSKSSTSSYSGLNPSSTRTKPFNNRGESVESPPNQPSYSDQFKHCTYPRELTNMFCAMECKLCAVKVQSSIQAKMHYSGQKHLKKIKKYLLEWSLKTGLPMPTSEKSTTASTPVDALPNFCEVCDVKMISTSDKILHYAGKNHKKNLKDPGNAKKKKKSYEIVDITSRFGIGSDFKKEMCDASDKSDDNIKEFFCELCDVRAVIKEEFQKHQEGKKHKKMLKKKNLVVPNPVNPSVSILASVVKDQPRDIIDYSMHRTPSGHFYCGVCNLTLNSELQFIEHIENKKHKKNFTGKKTHK